MKTHLLLSNQNWPQNQYVHKVNMSTVCHLTQPTFIPHAPVDHTGYNLHLKKLF